MVFEVVCLKYKSFVCRLLAFSPILCFSDLMTLCVFRFSICSLLKHLIAGLLELSLNQMFYYDSEMPPPPIPPPVAVESPPESPPSPLAVVTPMVQLRRGKLRSRRRKAANSCSGSTSTTTTKKSIPPPTVRSSSAANLARNADMRDDGKLQCPQCPNAYTRLSALKRHLEFECGMLENFRCQVCDAGFKRKDSLNRHCKVKKHNTKYLF